MYKKSQPLKKKKFYFSKKKRIKLEIKQAKLYAQCNYKNTLLSLTKMNGEVLKQWSTKSLKKTKFKKNNPYNVQFIINLVNKYLKVQKINLLNVYIKGTGLGKYNIFKNLKNVRVSLIIDHTPQPFNGCRKKKLKRR